VALWITQSWRPESSLDRVALLPFDLVALWALGLLWIYAQLAGLPKGSIAILATSALLSLWWLTTEPGIQAVAAITATAMLAMASIGVITLRWLAQRRWCNGDLPRAAT
jgi:hypothetical protein